MLISFDTINRWLLFDKRRLVRRMRDNTPSQRPFPEDPSSSLEQRSGGADGDGEAAVRSVRRLHHPAVLRARRLGRCSRQHLLPKGILSLLASSTRASFVDYYQIPIHFVTSSNPCRIDLAFLF